MDTRPAPQPTREDYIAALERVKRLHDLRAAVLAHFDSEIARASAECSRIERERMG